MTTEKTINEILPGEMFYKAFDGVNKDFEKMGHMCGYEYCIETFPNEKGNEFACPVFGHDCPGGNKEQIKHCYDTGGDTYVSANMQLHHYSKDQKKQLNGD